MSLRKQWLLSILIVLLTAAWWVGREPDSAPYDGTTTVSSTAVAAPRAPVEPENPVTDHPLPTTRLLPAVHAVTTGPHAFIETNPDGTPVTWSPCRAIHYTVNSDEAPTNGMQVVHAAIDQVSAATGLKFVQDGRTHVVPSESDHGLPADVPAGVDATYVPVLISWATEDEFPPLAGGVVGVATPYAFDTGSSYFKPRHVYQYVTGEVVLDADYNRNIAAQGWTGEEQAIVMHELGHLVGLDHVHASTELMNKDNAGLLHYGPGDLQGLAEAGNGRCTF